MFSDIVDGSSQIGQLMEHPSVVRISHCPEMYLIYTTYFCCLHLVSVCAFSQITHNL